MARSSTVRNLNPLPTFRTIVAAFFFATIANLLFALPVYQTKYHFNMLRSILEKTASFHGYRHFAACLKRDADDEEGLLHQRLVNILSHGSYSLYEPQEMLEEKKMYFRKILHDFIHRYPFNPALFPSAPAAPPAATPTAPAPPPEEAPTS